MHVEMESQLGFKLGQMPSREVSLSVCQFYSVLLYHRVEKVIYFHELTISLCNLVQFSVLC